MARKLVIHVFHDDESSLNTGTHVAGRIRQAMDPAALSLEVYVFGPAEKAMAKDGSAMHTAISELTKTGVRVVTCRSTAEALGKVEAFKSMGVEVEYARDAFIRYAMEDATVISF